MAPLTDTKTVTVAIKDIQIGDRTRQDMGDLDALVASIGSVGLLQPIGVLPDLTLAVGQRRLLAVQRLGWEKIPVHVCHDLGDIAKLARAEADENICRKDFTPEEAVRQARKYETAVKEMAKARQREGGKSSGGDRKSEEARKRSSDRVPVIDRKPNHDRSSKETREQLGATVGMSGKTFERAQTVIEAAEKNPELFSDTVDRMNKTGNVAGAYKDMQRKQAAHKTEEAAETLAKIVSEAERTVVENMVRHQSMEELLTGLTNLDAIITDPPYPKEFVGLYGKLAELATKALKPDGILAVMCGQSYLPEIMAAMSAQMPYRWTIAYMTPGGQAVQLWDRSINTFWKPILLFGGSPRWTGDVVRSESNDNDKRFHDWGQSESGMRELVEKLTKPEDLVCDPFIGAGTTGVVCMALGRKFVGCDINEGCVKKARDRIILATKEVLA